MSASGPPPAAVVVLAGGSGTRVGAGTNKALLPLLGTPVLVRSLLAALTTPGVHRLVLVVRPEEREEVAAVVTPHLGRHDLWLLDGGPTRHASEWHALRALGPEIRSGEIEVVAVHDAARPLASPALFASTVAAAVRHGGAVPAAAQPGLLAVRRDAGRPGALLGVQTPQAFRAAALLEAHERAAEEGFTGTDTASVVERYGDLPVVAVPSSTRNLKVTFPEDVALAERLIRRFG